MPLDRPFVPDQCSSGHLPCPVLGLLTAVPLAHTSLASATGSITADTMVATQPLQCIVPLSFRLSLALPLTFRLGHGEQRFRYPCAKAPVSNDRTDAKHSRMFPPPPGGALRVRFDQRTSTSRTACTCGGLFMNGRAWQSVATGPKRSFAVP